MYSKQFVPIINQQFENQRLNLFDTYDHQIQYQTDPPQQHPNFLSKMHQHKFYLILFFLVFLIIFTISQFFKILQNQSYHIQKLNHDQTLNFQHFSHDNTQQIKKQFDKIDGEINSASQINKKNEQGIVKQLEKVNKGLQILNTKTKKISENVSISQKYWQSIEINSKITDQTSILISFFDKKNISQFKLLYRASENNFSVVNFHNKCDLIPNTLLLIKNEHDKIIGGFTNLKWDRNKQAQFQKDTQNQTFIFSLSMKEKFWPTQPNQQVIKNYKNFGPVFAGASGPADLIIFDSANVASRSFSQFPNHFNNRRQYKHNGDVTTLFVGSRNQRFIVKEWQIFEVIFK